MLTHTRVLVVDAEGPDVATCRHLLAAAGYETVHVTHTDDAIVQLAAAGSDVVLCSLEHVGLQGIARLASAAEGAHVVIVVGEGRVTEGREAMRLGAFDLVRGAEDVDALLSAVERAALAAQQVREVAMLRARLGDRVGQALVGRSGAMTRVRELIGRAAGSRMTVLITGEPGTGKDVVARLVHDLSDRAGRPFVTVRCAGADALALEAELFGGTRPAGVVVRRGLFEEARGGTLVLDDVSAIPAALRARIALLLSERLLRQAGAGALIPIDVRLILTSREELDPVALFSGGEGQPCRLNVLPIALSPLRERRSDVPLLVQHFRARLASESGGELPTLGTDAMMALLGQQWPGNVRELEHFIEQSVYHPAAQRSGSVDASLAGGNARDDRLTLEDLERRHILRVLEQEDGHQSRAADRLGIDRRTLYRKLKQYRDDGVEFRAAL